MTDLQSTLQTSLGGTYRIDRELGGGGMSRVFVAEETALGRNIVLKVLPPELAAGVSVDRFRREIQLAASLQHPHIVPLHSAGSAGELFYYTMPLVEGESLRDRLARQGELPVGDVIRILRDVVDALAHAHAHHVVHRDIKPDNILLSGRHALVTDFGVAKAVSEATGEISITSMGVALGTPTYMAPEQATAEPNLDHRVDIYAVGIVAYEMLTGRTPFQAQNAQQMLAAQVMEVPTPVTAHRASVPAALAELIQKCLEKKPADRWQSAEDLHRVLDALATPSGGTTPTDTRPVQATAPAPSAPKWAGIAAAAAVALGVIGFIATRGGGDAPTLDPNVVVVLPFRVAGADQSLHYLREGMMDLLSGKFTGEGGPRAADPRTVANAWRGAGATETEDLSQPAALEVAASLGAGQLLLGGIVGSPGRVVLNATLVAVPAGNTRAQVTVEGSADSLPALIDDLARRVLVQGTGASIQTAATLTTTSLDALRAYLAGQTAYRHGAYQEAADHYTRAIDADSTFATAAFGLRVATGWGARGDRDRAARLAWAGRDRMSERDRALMDAYIGPDYPEESDWATLLEARERAVRLAPDHPDAWYFLADAYLHQGRHLGYRDWVQRAKSGFERALALDSTFAGPVSHMVDIAFEERDTAAMRRYGETYLATDGALGGGYAQIVRWRMGRLLGDSARLREVLTSFDTASARFMFLPWVAQFEGADPAQVDELLDIAARRASSRPERENYYVAQAFVLLDRARPAAALRRLDSLAAQGGNPVAAPYLRIHAALHAGADTVAGETAAATLGRIAAAPVGTTRLEQGGQLNAACGAGRWDAARGRLDQVARQIARLMNVADDASGAMRHAAETCALILEAMLAVARDAPNARAAVDRANVYMLGGPQSAWGAPYANLTVTRLYDALGDPEAALEAVRRWEYFGLRTAAHVREEGRLAAALGDHEAALEAYSELLRLWANPEPSMQAEVDAVRAEVERLTRAQG